MINLHISCFDDDPYKADGAYCVEDSRLTLNPVSAKFAPASGFREILLPGQAITWQQEEVLMNHDTLSDVLRFVRLRGAVFYDNYFGAQWAVEAPAAKEIAGVVMPGAEHVMEYHLITRGSGWAAIVGESPVRLETGDIVLFPHGDAHVMSSAPGMRPPSPDFEWLRRTSNLPKPILVTGETEGLPDVTRQQAPNNLVCGFLGCDLRPFNPLLANLPRILHLPARQEGNWITPALMQAINASHDGRPGCEALLERLSEMMFVDAIRRYVDTLPEESSGWLAGLRNRHVGHSLALLHADPARAWTIEELAKEVALSRSAFYDRFLALIGQPPMQYLTQWRMQLGARLLRETQSPVAAIALDVGYESEAAFARAFKRVTGKPPATWRRELHKMQNSDLERNEHAPSGNDFKRTKVTL